MPYILLAAAIAAEVAGTTAMKFSEGFTKLWPSLITLVGYVIAFTLLAQTLKSMSVGTAYAIWAGVGTAAIAAIGMVFMGEAATAAKIGGIALVIAGVVLLNLGGDHALMAGSVRRYDPDRRDRIIDAAIRVVGARGIAGLSHRSVAAEADVPLGSTTYHFKSLDDLLVAALRQANEGFARVVEDSAALADPDADLAGGLAALLGEFLGADRARAELEYELYLAALRRPALRPVAAEWCEAVAAALSARTDPATARALVAVMDGIGLQVLLTGAEYDQAYACEILRRVLRA